MKQQKPEQIEYSIFYNGDNSEQVAFFVENGVYTSLTFVDRSYSWPEIIVRKYKDYASVLDSNYYVSYSLPHHDPDFGYLKTIWQNRTNRDIPQESHWNGSTSVTAVVLSGNKSVIKAALKMAKENQDNWSFVGVINVDKTDDLPEETHLIFAKYWDAVYFAREGVRESVFNTLNVTVKPVGYY